MSSCKAVLSTSWTKKLKNFVRKPRISSCSFFITCLNFWGIPVNKSKAIGMTSIKASAADFNHFLVLQVLLFGE